MLMYLPSGLTIPLTPLGHPIELTHSLWCRYWIPQAERSIATFTAKKKDQTGDVNGQVNGMAQHYIRKKGVVDDKRPGVIISLS